MLGYRGVRQSSVAADSPLLIASGQYDEAEQHLEVALRSFNILRSAKLVNLHQLILLRHAQGKWRDAAVLCQALLRQRLGTLKPLARSSRLLLAESLLELNDLPAAYQAIAALYQQKLSLAEAPEPAAGAERLRGPNPGLGRDGADTLDQSRTGRVDADGRVGETAGAARPGGAAERPTPTGPTGCGGARRCWSTPARWSPIAPRCSR